MTGRIATLLVLSGLVLFSGCGKESGPAPDASQAGGETTRAAAQVDSILRRLPANTLGYARIEGVANLKERLSQVLPRQLKNAGPIQEKLDSLYAKAFQQGGQSNLLGLQEADLKELVAGLSAIHLAVVPAPVDARGLSEPLPLVFLQWTNDNLLDATLKKMGAALQPKELKGVQGFRLKNFEPLETALPLDQRTLVLGPDHLLTSLLAEPVANPLAGSPLFQRAVQDMGGQGDLFAFVSIDAIKEEILRDLDNRKMLDAEKERRRKEVADMPFRQVAAVAATAAVDGVLTIQAYTGAGQEFPAFLVRTPAAKKLLGRIPAEAVLSHVGGFDGGKNTRRGFVEWAKEETQRGGGGLNALGIPKSLSEGLIHNLDRLESDVVIKVRGMAEDLWLAAIPVKSELALAVAPDARNRWGLLMAFDIEDRSQAEKLKKEIFEAGKGQGLPWKQTTHEGLAIHYLDLEDILKEKGGNLLPKEVLENFQLQLGYAMNDELFLAGSVELIKFAQRPTGRTMADALTYQGVDEQNVLLYNFQPGYVLKALAKFEPLAKPIQPFVDQIPLDASYTMTLTVKKDRAVLRSNVPVTGLLIWGLTQWTGDRQSQLIKGRKWEHR